MKCVLKAGLLSVTLVANVFAGEIGFVEDFSLATDRTQALKQLIPGTEDYYYWHSIHLLNTEQYDEVEDLLKPWVQRHGETSRVWEIRTRRSILTYDQNPEESLQYLRSRFGIRFPHRKEELGAEPNLPVALDPALISCEAYHAQALRRHGNSLNGFHDPALDWLITTDLTPDQRRQLLSRLKRPDHDSLVTLVAADLDHKNSGGFGSHGIHRQMLKAQLDELLGLKPRLLNDANFVRAYITKLQPSPDVDWRRSPEELRAYLDRLQAFADQLAPVHNSLKAHVIYQQLVLDRLQGQYDKERFLSYLKLPRRVGYLSKAMRESEDLKRFACDLNTNYDGTTLMSAIGNDEPLVRSYLSHFFIEAGGTQEFELYIDSNYLRHLFAETKILHGLGNDEQWASLLPPERFRQLKDRVDLNFDFTNDTRYSIDAPVSLTLQVKNVSTLIVKVFEINTQNFYRRHAREVSTDINLDGLVANVERTYQYDEPPLRQVTRKFDFPELKKAGVYVVDFIGNGHSSRALIRKGHLKHLVRTTPAGQEFTILDENNQPVSDASLWLAGHEYHAGENGKVTVPFSTKPGRQSIVLSAPAPGVEDGTYSSLSHFTHESESYDFRAGFYVDRESLLTRQKAQLMVRPGLSVNGTPVSLKLLEDIKLTITSTDLDGVASSIEVPDFKLFEDRETIHELKTPQRLATLHVRLSARVKQLTSGEMTNVAAAQGFSLNGISKTEKIEDMHLLRADGKYVVELRGRTGEAKQSRPVSVTFYHHDFRDDISTVLKSDPQGRIALGSLTEIRSLTASGPEGTQHTWNLVGDRHTYESTLHGRVGESIVLPYLGKQQAATRSELSLLELSGNTFGQDRFENIKIEDGLIVIEDLPAGDFSLLLKETGTAIQIRVTDGQKLGSFVVGPLRQLETKTLPPIQIESITADDEHVIVKVQNSSKFARVHVLATRYVPEYDAYANLSRVGDVEPYLFRYTPAESVYLTGRNIGDEYRYIIDRKYAQKYPGNMLTRPSLLLNPWAVRETETGEQLAAGGDAFGRRGGTPESDAERAPGASMKSASQSGHFANFDFLASSATVLSNLTPDEDGLLRIPRAGLGPHQYIRVVAVDPLNTTSRTFDLPERESTFVDLRLADNLNPEQHFSQRKEISIVQQGEAFTLNDITTAQFEAYDSLARVYGLYATLNNDASLKEFSFILRWPTLNDIEKRTLYSKYASHELSFFLERKDPEFFEAVVEPHLVNKKDKTFMDHYLLADDLSAYLDPWKYAQLNVVERALLARRINGELAKTSRHIADLHSLKPQNIDEFIRLFDTAAQRSALETGDVLGIEDKLSEITASEAGLFDARSGRISGMFGGGNTGASSRIARSAAPQSESRPPESFRRQLSAAKAEKSKALKELESVRKRANFAYDAPVDGTMADDYFEIGGVAGRKSVRQLYRNIDKTWEWAENNYHHLTIDRQNADLVTVNAFWKDFAAHDPAEPFLSRHIADASRNFPEMLLAISVLDLPFESPEHKTEFDGTRMTLTPGGAAIIFHEEIQPSAAPGEGNSVLVSQNIFKQGDRHRTVNGEKIDKFVTGEFVVHTVYGCQVVITNPTSTRQKLNVLLQIPKGALPLLGGKMTRTQHINLEPYHTQTVEYHFYFPAEGEYPHFPVHVSKNEDVIAAADPVAFHVVDKPTQLDTESWDYVSQEGTLAEVVTFLNKHNVEELDLNKIAWRVQELDAFQTILPLLAHRHVYNHTLWSYALKHNDPIAASQYIRHAQNIINECGGRLSGTLVTIDPVERRTYEHLEYSPLVNARTHALGQRRQIVNERLNWQYHRLLKEFAYERQLDDADRLTVTYYLFLQDRVEEALASFEKVNRANLTTQMQYDYCDAYCKFYSDNPQQARAIAAKYADYPVDRWRNTFAVITAQLDEARGASPEVIDPENRDQQQGVLAASEPNFDFTVEARKVSINHQNLSGATINFYEMDVELLFSRNPFVQQFGNDFASIMPNHSLSVDLPDEEQVKVLELPQDLTNSNVLVEVVAAGQTRTSPYYANSLSVQTIENYGQVRVSHRETHRAVSKAYVKVYARLADGSVKFYKDGYTDLRGRFDYASLNTNELDNAQQFAILVLSDEHGALVREATPPKR